MNSEFIRCPYELTCSGCQLLALPYTQQQSLKIQHLRDLLRSSDLGFSAEIQFLSAGSNQLRDRLDFTLQKQNLGLYRKNSREIIDLESCLQLSPALQDWLTEFRQIRWPVERASFRLRVGPQGQRGVWLDMANLDIKKILLEGHILERLQQQAVVEIGQRRKQPLLQGGGYKLQDPQLNIWFQTWMAGQAVDLYCHVASFTQPSLRANKLIAETLQDWLSRDSGLRIIEFGSGIGNLSFPVLPHAESLLACEIDALSLQGLQRTLRELSPAQKQLTQKMTLYRGDFQKKLRQDFSAFDLILANPPRSGLGGFLEPLTELAKTQRPEKFIYMSCFPDSFVRDLRLLTQVGYKIKKLRLVDQFPQTQHYEILSLLQRE